MNLKFKKSPKRLKKKRKYASSCDICLIVHGNELLHSKHQNLVAQPDESVLKLTPSELAAAARRLLPVTTKRPRIVLALPSSEFVATSLTLPTIAAQNVRNVVNLQLPTLLPGVTEPLLLAVQAPIAEGEPTCALWMPAKRADELFQAFDKVGFFLSCILPRPVIALSPTSTHCRVYDEDDTTITCIEWSNGVIQRWLHTPKTDYDEPEFHNQLDEALSIFSSDIQEERRTSVDAWKELPMPLPVAYDYAFLPPSAAAQMAKAARQKKRRFLAVFVVLLIFGMIGGIYFAIDYKQDLEQQLVDLKRRTVNTSQLRIEVGEIEEIIGPFQKFPRQEVVTVLDTLNSLIPKDSWITSFRIEGGIIKLDGESPDPTNLLEILTNTPQFDEVHQSKDIVKQRNKKELKFGIDLKLKDFDLATYWLEYFPDKR